MGRHFYADADIASIYRWFAEETRDSSPTWTRVCRWVADTPTVIDRLDTLPGMKRQPQLFLAGLRWLGAPLAPGPDLAEWIGAHWGELRTAIMEHSTQTNEAARTAGHLPVLAGLPGPIALIEVGSSAGLCLVPDAYAFRYRIGEEAVELGQGRPLIDCTVSGATPVECRWGLPDIAHRVGIDIAPLDPRDPAVRRWLGCLVWPGQEEREVRLREALDVVAARDVPVVTGDALEELPAVVADARELAPTVVVMHTATLSYLPRGRRAAFGSLVAGLGARWLSCEGERVVPQVRDRLVGADTRPGFVLALDGRPLARVGAHGGWIDWLPTPAR